VQTLYAPCTSSSTEDVIPSQEMSPQTTPNCADVALSERPDVATQERESTMQEQRSIEATGGRSDGAAQDDPVVGQARSSVLVGV